jgi:hypothetical protein
MHGQRRETNVVDGDRRKGVMGDDDEQQQSQESELGG